MDVRDLGEPEAVVSHPLGATHQVRLAQTVISRHVLQPGWSWEEHARPDVGTRSCELYHRGVVLSGRMGVRTDEGEELVIGPNHVAVHAAARIVDQAGGGRSLCRAPLATSPRAPQD